MSPSEEADVVVIGSGAGGAPVAAVLAEAGARVVILEKGPYYTSQDFVHDEVKICRRDFWVPYLDDEPHTIRETEDAASKRTRSGWTSCCVGGATVHMSGFFYRLNPSDFRLSELTGGVKDADVADWPISIEEMLPFYDLLEARIGISGRAGINPFEVRHRPFPLPPLLPHPAAALFDAAARSLGYHPYPTPRAVVSRTFGRRPPCNYCGLCGDYGCENASKSSTLVTFVPAAEATGRCQVRPCSMASRILVDDSPKVTGVEYVDRHGQTRQIGARAVCLAASAIESARLLLLSESSRFPQGLANGSGLVGRNLTFSTFGKGMAVFDRQELAARLGPDGMDLPFFQRSVQDHYWMESPGAALPKGGTYNFILQHPGPIGRAARVAGDARWQLFGEALKDRLRQAFRDELAVEVEVFGESLPWKGSYVDLDPKVKDRFGLPVARITARNHPAANEVNEKMVRNGLQMLEAMKPAAQRVSVWTAKDATYHLQQGSCRFGTDPAFSVLDPACQAHEVRNLYVTDGSFMPTSGGVPSTETIMANSLRVGSILRDRFLRREI
ncbi:MAG: GMC family oxidoreductase [bacterium]